jgi:spore coat polysaccharide biosynthesis protein SpsF
MVVGIVVQARMSSARLPGKVLRRLAGTPMLGHILDALGRCRLAQRVVLATSDQPEDDPVAELARTVGAGVYRGSLPDVLDRYVGAAHAFGFDSVVRATGDNPFVDPEETDRLIAFFREGGLAYASNQQALGSGLPVGIGVEIFSTAALERSWDEAKDAFAREHVNPHVQRHPDAFPQAVLPAPSGKTAPDLSFTVDTEAEFNFAEAMLARFAAEGGHGRPGTPWLIAAARRGMR